MSTIAQNRKAYHDYEVIEKMEAGIALAGSEVKSIRAGKVNLADSYAQCIHGEIFLHNLHITNYKQSGLYTPEPGRKRKLLLQKRQINYLSSEVDRKQLTIIPLSIYFKKQWVKIEIGLCRGMKKYDKRQKIAKEESKRHLAQVVRNHRGL